MRIRLLLSSISLLCLFSFYSVAQSKKNIKKNKVKSTSVTTTEDVKGAQQTFKDTYEEYDSDGNTIVDIEYNPDGTVKKKETYKFNKNGDVLEHVVYGTQGEIKKSTTMKYSALFDKIEELRYEGASNKLVEREVYTYNAQGQRTSEVTLDDKGVLIKKAIYTYDKKGLKLEKKTVDGKDKLLSDKKYTYEYK